MLGLGEFGAFLSGGSQQFSGFVKGQRPFISVLDTKTVIIAMAGSLAIAMLLAAACVPTIRLWWQDGQYWRKGNVVTVLLWIASIVSHLAYNAIVSRKVAAHATFGDFGSATLLLYSGVSLITQRILLGIRTVRIPKHEN